MRVRVFTEIDLDPTEILSQARESGHNITEQAVPQMVAQAIHGLIEQAIPGVQANGSVVIPELTVSPIVKPSRFQI